MFTGLQIVGKRQVGTFLLLDYVTRSTDSNFDNNLNRCRTIAPNPTNTIEVEHVLSTEAFIGNLSEIDRLFNLKQILEHQEEPRFLFFKIGDRIDAYALFKKERLPQDPLQMASFEEQGAIGCPLMFTKLTKTPKKLKSKSKTKKSKSKKQ